MIYLPVGFLYSEQAFYLFIKKDIILIGHTTPKRILKWLFGGCPILWFMKNITSVNAHDLNRSQHGQQGMKTCVTGSATDYWGIGSISLFINALQSNYQWKNAKTANTKISQRISLIIGRLVTISRIRGIYNRNRFQFFLGAFHLFSILYERPIRNWRKCCIE